MREIALIVVLAAGLGAQQTVEAVAVVAIPVQRKIELTGELRPFQESALRAPVTGVVEKVLVDRGARVAEGQLLAVLSAPELDAQVAEAVAQQRALESQAARDATNEAAQARVEALERVRAQLRITAPYAGVITARDIHPGALAGPRDAPLFNLQQQDMLRLVVAVAEEDAGSIPRGRVNFVAPALPNALFYGAVARNAGSIDPQSHTLAVEIDVRNPSGRLLPGMRAKVTWPVLSQGSVALVPESAIATAGNRTFVNRIRHGAVEWVDVVKQKPSSDNLVEVRGDLDSGDVIARRGSDQLRPGTRVQAKLR